MSLHLLDVETGRVVDGRVVLNHGRDQAAILLDELGSPVADCAEALHNEALARDASGEVDTVGEALGVEELADGVVNSETRRLGASGNTALRNELASAAALGVDILLTLHVHVGVLDPGHDLLVGSHVGSEAINLSTDEALLDELHSVLTGDSLDLILGVLAGVNLDATLATTEGNVSDGKFEGHQGGKGLNFLQIKSVRVAGTSLDGQLVS